MRVAIVGAGWAGLSAAVRAVDDGHQVTLWEATRQAGGRARTLDHPSLSGFDNGQHILIGAYTDTLALMRRVGADPETLLARQPLALRYPDGSGLTLPDWPRPLDLLAGIVSARGWGWRDKMSLVRTALGWRAAGFRCAASATVQDLCSGMRPTVLESFIAPLCVAALNTPAERASGQVFLRVLQDALFGVPGGSQLLLPRVDLGQLLPAPAMVWLKAQGCQLRIGERVQSLQALVAEAGQTSGTTSGTRAVAGWLVQGEAFDLVIIATPNQEAARLVQSAADSLASDQPGDTSEPELCARLHQWAQQAQALPFQAITTVYAHSASALPQAMLALHATAEHPAQFVFDRSRLAQTISVNASTPAHMLAFVASASQGERSTLQAQVVAQAREQLGLAITPLTTVVEKRATFACLPSLVRPAIRLAPGLSACGDYVEGPYPATLEGAVRSGSAAVEFSDS